MAAGVGVKVGIGGATVETGEDIEVGIGVGGWTTAGAQAEKINVDNSSQLIKNIACRFTGFTFFCTIVLVSYPVLTPRYRTENQRYSGNRPTICRLR